MTHPDPDLMKAVAEHQRKCADAYPHDDPLAKKSRRLAAKLDPEGEPRLWGSDFQDLMDEVFGKGSKS